MSNPNRRLFWGAFFLTLLLFAWLAAFLIVDYTSAQFQSAAAPALAVEYDPKGAPQLALLGERYPLSPSPYAQLEALRQKYPLLLTPGPLLALQPLGAWAKQGESLLYNWYQSY